MSSAINPISTMSTTAAAASSSSSSSTAAAATSSTSLASENVFLQLLVAQLQNQDPESPSDPTQFVTQLAQFTTLEQSVDMRTDLDQLVTDLGPAAPTAPVGATGGTGGTGGTGTTGSTANSGTNAIS